MSVNGTDWLRKLTGIGAANGVGAAGSGSAPAPAPANPLDAAAFQAMLAKARGGEGESGRAVTVDSGVPVSLSDEQVARLARAVDRAEAEGFASAVVNLDGLNLLLDVQGRRITGVVDASSPVAADVDGVVMAQAAEPIEGMVGQGEVSALAPDAARLLRGSEALRMLATPAAKQAQSQAQSNAAGTSGRPLAGAA